MASQEEGGEPAYYSESFIDEQKAVLGSDTFKEELAGYKAYLIDKGMPASQANLVAGTQLLVRYDIPDYLPTGERTGYKFDLTDGSFSEWDLTPKGPSEFASFYLAAVIGVMTTGFGAAMSTGLQAAGYSASAANALGAGIASTVSTGIQGGNLEEALLAGVTAGLGSTLATAVSGGVDTLGITSGITNETLQQIANDALVGGVTSAFTAVLRDGDPLEAFITGGLQAGVSTSLNQLANSSEWKEAFGAWENTSDVIKQIATDSLTTVLQGEDVTAATITRAITKSLLTATTVTDVATSVGVDLQNTENNPGAAYLASGLRGVVDTILEGGNSDQLTSVALNTLQEYAKNRLFTAMQSEGGVFESLKQSVI